jgi:outer membrane protein assembly factor BamE (lipoprotein component of BamABCDE complex)
MNPSFLKRLGQGFFFSSYLLSLSGCTPTIQNRGWIPQECLLDQFKPGITTKDQIQCALGVPTLISTFDDKTWYYISQVTKSETSFSRPKLLKSDVYVFEFGPDQRLISYEVFDKEKIREITPVPRETDTRGYNVSILKQMFKNLGRFNAGGQQK